MHTCPCGCNRQVEDRKIYFEKGCSAKAWKARNADKVKATEKAYRDRLKAQGKKRKPAPKAKTFVPDNRETQQTRANKRMAERVNAVIEYTLCRDPQRRAELRKLYNFDFWKGEQSSSHARS